MTHLKHRNSCRVCGSSSLTPVVELGEQYLQGSFVKRGTPDPPMRKIPTTLVHCDPTRDEQACGLLQMKHTVPQSILYDSYWYRSGTNQTMRSHLSGIADEAVKCISRHDKLRVLDIGCNDGTLLLSYPKTFSKFGIDPSNAATNLGDDIRIITDVFPSTKLATESQGVPFDIITSIAMFYDLEDPVAFAKAVKACLADDGVWIFEMSYMPSMLKMNAYDTICHEHLEYYSLAVIEEILARSGMRLAKVSLNDINGGSIRCYAIHSESSRCREDEALDCIQQLRREEFDRKLESNEPYLSFQKRIDVHREELRSLLCALKEKGKTIHIYGASTKGNTILQWCEIDTRLVDYAADRNPAKHGAFTLGTNIPIISEDTSRAMRPDYYLVLPWHFKSEFMSRESETLKRGTCMIFPLPTIQIISARDVE